MQGLTLYVEAMLVHIFQVIPILLFLASGSTERWFDLGSNFELPLLCIFTGLAFFLFIKSWQKKGAAIFSCLLKPALFIFAE